MPGKEKVFRKAFPVPHLCVYSFVDPQLRFSRPPHSNNGLTRGDTRKNHALSMYGAFRDVLKTPPCLVKNIGRCICWCYGREGLSRTTVPCPVNNSATRTGDKRAPLLRGLQVRSKDVHVPRGEAMHKGTQQQERAGETYKDLKAQTHGALNTGRTSACICRGAVFLLSFLAEIPSFRRRCRQIRGPGLWSNSVPPRLNTVNVARLGERGPESPFLHCFLQHSFPL